MILSPGKSYQHGHELRSRGFVPTHLVDAQEEYHGSPVAQGTRWCRRGQCRSGCSKGSFPSAAESINCNLSAYMYTYPLSCWNTPHPTQTRPTTFCDLLVSKKKSYINVWHILKKRTCNQKSVFTSPPETYPRWNHSGIDKYHECGSKEALLLSNL